jgi:HD-GYP domain-containing protein (c-di-GMP phosphodiesterase class II)
MQKKMSNRATVHYLFSLLALTVYGGQVCPFIDSLNIVTWALLLAIVFGSVLVLRCFALRLALGGDSTVNRVGRRFIAETAMFVAAGTFIAVYNFIAFGFPALSGSKIVIVFLSLGFFAAMDLALEEERQIAVEARSRGVDLVPERRALPVTGKFAIIISVSVLFMSAVAFLVLNRDLIWLAGMKRAEIPSASRVVLLEMGFVGAVFLAEILNLILAYAKNLRLFFSSENSTLSAVASGDLNSRVPVSTNDEFGAMARYTNRMIEELRTRTEEVQRTQDVTILALKDLAETRDNETGMHILRTQRYVRVLAEYLREHPGFREVLDEGTIDLLFKSAPLHDIGKVGVRDSILLKPARLTSEEVEEMKKHTVYGRDALARAERALGESSFLRIAAEMAYTHHEKWDGTGYPDGLKRDNIPVSGRLMALADVYDALVFKRVYKSALSHEQAYELIVKDKGKHFDPDVVDAFLSKEDVFRSIAEKFKDEPAENRGHQT